MARKNLTTSPDDDHVQFGDTDSYTQAGLPPDFNPGGDGEFNPQYFGRIMDNPDNAGFGSASIEPEEAETD
jgi:hypothetical protein